MGERIGAKRALVLTMLSGAASLLALALSTHFYLLTLVYLVYAFFGNSMWSPLTALVADVTPVTERGIGYSYYFITEGIVVSIIPSIAAAVIGVTNIWFIFPFSILFLIAGVATLQLLSYVHKRSKH